MFMIDRISQTLSNYLDGFRVDENWQPIFDCKCDEINIHAFLNLIWVHSVIIKQKSVNLVERSFIQSIFFKILFSIVVDIPSMLCVGAGLSGFSAGPYRRLRTEDTAAIYSLFAQGLLTLGSIAFTMDIPGEVFTDLALVLTGSFALGIPAQSSLCSPKVS